MGDQMMPSTIPLTKLLIQGLAEYLQFSFSFERAFSPFPLPPSRSAEDLSVLIKSKFPQLSSAVDRSPLCLNRLKRGL